MNQSPKIVELQRSFSWMRRSVPGGAIGPVAVRLWIGIALGLLFLAVGTVAGAGGYRTVTGPCGFVFPRDHGVHPAYRTEWWYYTGHLATEAGRRFGFQLTFFRHRLAPPDDRTDRSAKTSAWRTDQVYLAHAALTDVAAGQHRSAEQMARGAAGLAGAALSDGIVTVHLGGWSARIAPEGQRVAAAAEDFALNLDLTPRKPPAAHGDGGYSRKGNGAGRASCYYSFTRLEARGEVTVDGRTHAVSGLAWMDHEYSTAPLEPGLVGWDWFSLQLEDGTDLMLFGLRRAAGGWHPASAGTVVAADGAIRHLSREALRLEVTRRWKSPRTGGDYPAGWRLRIPSAGIDLEIRPALADQEMATGGTTGVTYWEGLVDVSGTRAGRPVAGHGFVELTGYAGAFDAPL